ncbi:hypothetical protein QJR26_07020 [Clostridium baratii]
MKSLVESKNKADKKTLLAVKSFLQGREGYDLKEIITEIVGETNMLKTKEMGENTLPLDECGIEWGDTSICTLDDFINEYTEKFINKIRNVLDSFMNEDIDSYFYDDKYIGIDLSSQLDKTIYIARGKDNPCRGVKEVNEKPY